jgi:ABC-type multidrug transport system permease subunit
VSFTVCEGEIFGLLGPNGAGKTTTVECITGLRHPDGGTISVLGLDPQFDGDALHLVVGVQLQSSTFPERLKVGEILDMYQSFYWNPANPEEPAQALGLGDKLGSYYKTLSGGQKQRLSVALALIGQPKIAVLDEMTTGLGIPLLLLVVFYIIPGTRQAQSIFGGVSYFALTFPILLALTILTVCIAVLPRNLIKYRETGILRRLSTTPVPPGWLLAAQIVINLAIVVAGLIILTAAGVAAFGLELPKNLPGFLLAYMLTATSLFAVGLCIAAFVRNDAVANGIGGVLFFALLFFGGVWIPRPLMPPMLLNISNWTPLGASVDALQKAMQGCSLRCNPSLYWLRTQ